MHMDMILEVLPLIPCLIGSDASFLKCGLDILFWAFF